MFLFKEFSGKLANWKISLITGRRRTKNCTQMSSCQMSMIPTKHCPRFGRKTRNTIFQTTFSTYCKTRRRTRHTRLLLTWLICIAGPPTKERKYGSAFSRGIYSEISRNNHRNQKEDTYKSLIDQTVSSVSNFHLHSFSRKRIKRLFLKVHCNLSWRQSGKDCFLRTAMIRSLGRLWCLLSRRLSTSLTL